MLKYKIMSLISAIRRNINLLMAERKLKIEDISIKEDEHGFIKISISASEVIDGLTLGERLYLKNSLEYGCEPDWLYRRAKQPSKCFEILGWNPSSYKFPITIKEIYNQETKRVSPETLKEIFLNSYLSDRIFNNPFHR